MAGSSVRALRPVATTIVFIVTAIVTAANRVDPEIGRALQRAPAAIQAHEWWRFLTPVLVNRGWKDVVFNLTGLGIIGTIAERYWGHALWIVFYLVGALVGEIAGLAWKPMGAGSSVAVCGLLGAVAAELLVIGTMRARFGAVVILMGALVLVGVRDLHGPPLLAGAAVALIAWARVRESNA
jgi:rhomboid protease GluP